MSAITAEKLRQMREANAPKGRVRAPRPKPVKRDGPKPAGRKYVGAER